MDFFEFRRWRREREERWERLDRLIAEEGLEKDAALPWDNLEFRRWYQEHQEYMERLGRWIAEEKQEVAALLQNNAEETGQPNVKRRRQDNSGMAEEAEERAIVVLELFSGIGGMHFALREAGITDVKVAAAMDISDVANRIYKHNFPKTNHVSGNICGLTAKKLNKMSISAIVMSPPCQPFTRQGLQKDIGDARTEPLLSVIKMIPDLERLDYVLVENVKGFEVSEARKSLVSALSSSGFVCREFLLTPTQIGIPNSRLRYYLIAKKRDIIAASSDGLFESLPEGKIIGEFPGVEKNIECGALGDYLETGDHLEDYLVGSDVLKKRAEVADIVTAEGFKSCCFTKSYGRYVEGTGSLIQQTGDLDAVYSRARQEPDEDKRVDILKELRLRHFSPTEIAGLLGFPRGAFSFPEEASLLQRYRVLGNSLNVAVVARLMKIMFGRANT